jgi:GxxExxY protein
MDEDQLNALTERIIGCAYRVAEKLKYGYLEKVYENAMRVELERCGFMVEQQKRIEVRYEGVLVGDYVADLVIEGRVLLEVKTCKEIDDAHCAQCLNYLHATGLPCGLLINFGPSVKVKRFRNFHPIPSL